MPWSIVSNAALRSSNISTDVELESKVCKMSFTTLVRAVLVEWQALKADLKRFQEIIIKKEPWKLLGPDSLYDFREEGKVGYWSIII